MFPFFFIAASYQGRVSHIKKEDQPTSVYFHVNKGQLSQILRDYKFHRFVTPLAILGVLYPQGKHQSDHYNPRPNFTLFCSQIDYGNKLSMTVWAFH